MMISPNLNLQLSDVCLRPLQEEHVADLSLMAQDNRIWDFLRLDLHRIEVFKEIWFSKAWNQKLKGERFPLVVTFKEKIIGSTSFYLMDPVNRSVCIGYTWYNPQFWGTKVNPSAKYLLLSHAFDNLKCIRVFFNVDSTNHRSQSAVLKLGAKQEGILRNHMIRSDGSYRDTVVFSIIESEWPSVRKKLEQRLEFIE